MNTQYFKSNIKKLLIVAFLFILAMFFLFVTCSFTQKNTSLNTRSFEFVFTNDNTFVVLEKKDFEVIARTNKISCDSLKIVNTHFVDCIQNVSLSNCRSFVSLFKYSHKK